MLKLGANVYQPRMMTCKTKYSLERPLRVLFYYEKKMRDELIWQYLEKSGEACDFLIIFNENITVLNRHLPLTKKILSNQKGPKDHPVKEQIYPLMKFMYYLALSTVFPMMANAWGVFETLFSRP